MSTSDRCPTCDATLFGGKTLFGHDHRCPPKWETWAQWDVVDPAKPEGLGDHLIVFASTAECAAADGFKEADEMDWADRDKYHFYVRLEGSPEPPEKWTVYREIEPTYRAVRA